MLRSVSNRSLLRCYRQKLGDPPQRRLQEAKWRYALSSSSSSSAPSSSFFVPLCTTKQQHDFEPKTERTTTPKTPPLRTQLRCFSLHSFQSSGTEPIISIALRRYHSTTREPSSRIHFLHRQWEGSQRIGGIIQFNPLHHVLLYPLRRPPGSLPRQCDRHKKKGIRWYNDSKSPGDKKTPSKEETSTVVQDKKQPVLEKSISTETSKKIIENGDLSGQSLPPPSDSLARIREEAREGSARLTALVDSVGPTLKRVSAEWNMGDLLSVYGIVALIGVILAAPMVVR
jgi:hypothetical protein